MELTGIKRSKTFSPFQHAENDWLILEHTAAELRRRGCRVTFVDEDDVGRRTIDAPVIFSMCQGPRANNLLTDLEKDSFITTLGRDIVLPSLQSAHDQALQASGGDLSRFGFALACFLAEWGLRRWKGMP